MEIRTITAKERTAFNTVVDHPLQSYEWGEFREKSGIKVIRRGFFEDGKLIHAFQLTIHPIPHIPWTIGYLPKGEMPTKEMLEELKRIGKEEKCIHIHLEPNVLTSQMENGKRQMANLGLIPAAHPLFTKYTFMLDLTKSEEDLLKAMHPKGRYNIKVAKRHGVQVREDNSDNAFQRYLELTDETTRRQKFYAHNKQYHQLQWKVFPHPEMKNGKWKMENQLTSHLFVAEYQGKILTTMLFFVFRDTLYYPYGASSNDSRNVMHSNLTMWEGIRFGKKLGLKQFDMWGAMGPNPDPTDPWYGFHTFKQRYGPEHVSFIGSYDLIINPVFYQGYKVADKLRWMLLKMKK